MAPPPDPSAEANEKAYYKRAVNDAQDAMHQLWKNGGDDRKLAATVHAGLQAAYQGATGNKHNVETAIKAISEYNGDPVIRANIQVIFGLDSKKLKKYTHGFLLPNVGSKDVHDSIGPTLPGVGSIPNPLEVLQVLTDKNTWLRVAEGLLGLLLLAIGINAVTKGTAAGEVISKAKTVGKVAIMKKMPSK